MIFFSLHNFVQLYFADNIETKKKALIAFLVGLLAYVILFVRMYTRNLRFVFGLILADCVAMGFTYRNTWSEESATHIITAEQPVEVITVEPELVPEIVEIIEKTPRQLQIFLVNLEEKMVKAWKKYFDGIENVSCEVGDIENYFEKSTAFVSASNSKLFFDGGSDLAYMEMFPNVQRKMKKFVEKFGYTDNFGLKDYLPIGAACIKQFDTKYLICAPTMLLPQDVSDTNNAYVAFKLVLELLDKNPRIDSIVIPAMCAGYGKMPYDTVAKQMIDAYDDHVSHNIMLDTVGDEKSDLVYDPTHIDTQPHYYANTQFMNFDRSEAITTT